MQKIIFYVTIAVLCGLAVAHDCTQYNDVNTCLNKGCGWCFTDMQCYAVDQCNVTAFTSKCKDNALPSGECLKVQNWYIFSEVMINVFLIFAWVVVLIVFKRCLLYKNWILGLVGFVCFILLVNFITFMLSYYYVNRLMLSYVLGIWPLCMTVLVTILYILGVVVYCIYDVIKKSKRERYVSIA